MPESRIPRLLTVVLIAVVCAHARLNAQQATYPFQDPSLSVDKRVNDLVTRMTIEEKASQLVNRMRAIPRLGVP